jgi:hypothetical protein
MACSETALLFFLLGLDSVSGGGGLYCRHQVFGFHFLTFFFIAFTFDINGSGLNGIQKPLNTKTNAVFVNVFQSMCPSVSERHFVRGQDIRALEHRVTSTACSLNLAISETS